MSDLFIPFSQGTQACLGKNLALVELKLVVAIVVKQYGIALGDTMKPGDMDMKDHFLALPKGGKCHLAFTKI
jgi:cytochrome P450